MPKKSGTPSAAGPKTKSGAGVDRSHDVFRGGRSSLEVFFAPKSVAVIGATDRAGTVGRTLISNLLSTPFGGTVYPVNPKHARVSGVQCYPSVLELPEPPDLAVVVTPAAAAPDVIDECARAGARGAVIISAGFKELGAEGARLEDEVRRRAAGRLRIVGPNCLGVMCPPIGLNATFASGMSLSGRVAFISQSGALCTAVLDWSLREGVGFSAFVSVGSMMDVGWGDLIDYLGEDPRTESIVIYMESVGNARSFISAARETAMTKPIILLKAGRSEAAAKAAASHTGALAGSDEVLDAALKRSGVLRVDSIADLFYMAGSLARQPRPKGKRLAVMTNAGGPGVLAADALIEHGGSLAQISPETLKSLNGILPAPWSHGNPVDILGDADPKRYSAAFDVLSRDPGIDGLLVILTPQAMTDPTGTAKALAALKRREDVPVLASWMGGESVEPGRRVLGRAGIPLFGYPDTAARVFTHMWRYSENLRALYETPIPAEDGAAVDGEAAEALLRECRAAGRPLLTEFESKKLLKAYGIPTVETVLTRSADEAATAAEKLGFPVAVKLHSFTLTHKSDVGGVRLDIKDAGGVRRAFEEIRRSVEAAKGKGHFEGVTVQPFLRREGYELILGSAPDPQFGPVLVFGAGGVLVEVFRDKALGLPPLTSTLALRMMEATKIFKALQGTRGRAAVDLGLLESLLVRFSRLVVEQKWVKEIDINPILASPEGLVALDARVVLHGPEVKEEDLPRPAIRPYPSQYSWPWKLRDGTAVFLRPIRPEDEPALVRFHATLSEQTVYMRYLRHFDLGERVAHDRLTRICFVDYDRELALVAERKGGKAKDRDILGVGRLSREAGKPEAEFALLVADPWQQSGLGTELLRRLIDIARREGLARVSAEIHPENWAMQKICEEFGFKLERNGGGLRAALDLRNGRRP